MIIKLPENLAGKELHDYLHANKALLVKQKKVGIKRADACAFAYVDKAETVAKASKDMHSESGALVVDVIANLSGWMDSDNDVILRGAYDKTVADGGYKPFLKNHNYDTDAIIAETLAVYTKDFAPSQLGIQSSATINPQGLVFKGKFVEDVAGKIYHQYKNKLIKQHSIGLRYIRLELAINDASFEQEYKAWLAYYPQVLNKEKADAEGYFWAILEIQCIENSAVVFGSNSQTPVISIVEETPAADSSTDVMDAKAVTDTEAKKAFSHYTMY